MCIGNGYLCCYMEQTQCGNADLVQFIRDYKAHTLMMENISADQLRRAFRTVFENNIINSDFQNMVCYVYIYVPNRSILCFVSCLIVE